jgi:hypothetical protein
LVSTLQGEIVAEGKERFLITYREGVCFEQEPEEMVGSNCSSLTGNPLQLEGKRERFKLHSGFILRFYLWHCFSS